MSNGHVAVVNHFHLMGFAEELTSSKKRTKKDAFKLPFNVLPAPERHVNTSNISSFES